MQYLFLSIAVVAGYFFVVFFLFRLVVPFMGFAGFSPEALPEDMKAVARELESKSSGPREYAEAVYLVILDKTKKQWDHRRFKAGTYLHRLFVKDADKMWKTDKFLYCQAINYLSFLLLINSRFFKPSDIRAKVVFLNFVPHQYLQVKVEGGWVDMDPAGSGIRNRPLGTHASFFG